MIGIKARSAILVCTVAAAWMGVPSEGSACQCLDWIWPWNWGANRVASSTTYAPPYVPSATVTAPAVASTCNPCATQVCSYVPQTYYRTVYRTTPVTTCQAVTCCDPCTGCPVTVYRPVVSYVQSAQLVPYTTYRAVWTNAYAPTCSPCATSSYAPATSSGCGAPCGTSVAPAQNDYEGGASTPPSLTPTPEPGSSTNPTGYSIPPRSSHSVERPPLPPIPADEPSEPSEPDTPRLVAPGERMTARPIQQASYHEVSFAPERSPEPLDTGGWRASRD